VFVRKHWRDQALSINGVLTGMLQIAQNIPQKETGSMDSLPSTGMDGVCEFFRILVHKIMPPHRTVRAP